jgi:hypothetical protein
MGRKADKQIKDKELKAWMDELLEEKRKNLLGDLETKT